MAAVAKTSIVEREEGDLPEWLDGVSEMDPQAVRAADHAGWRVFREFRDMKEDEPMSRAVIFGRAGETKPPEVLGVLDEQRRTREDRGDAEVGWVNAHEHHLWPEEEQRKAAEIDGDWIDAESGAHSG